MLPLLLSLLTSLPPLHIEVVVPLCDGAALECGRGTLGNPASLEGNLYWGAMYGAERFLSKAKGFSVVTRTDAPDAARPWLLRTVELTRAAAADERPLRVTLHAYDGTQIDHALREFLAKVASGNADLVVWAGHDRLMDVRAPAVTRNDHAAPSAVLACSSQQYFGPVLNGMGSPVVALTRTFMAPEAYLLEALAGSVARWGVRNPKAVRTSLVEAYARYQHISPKAAGTVFARLE